MEGTVRKKHLDYIFICDFTENQGSKRYFSCSLHLEISLASLLQPDEWKEEEEQVNEGKAYIFLRSRGQANVEQHEENQKSKKLSLGGPKPKAQPPPLPIPGCI